MIKQTDYNPNGQKLWERKFDEKGNVISDKKFDPEPGRKNDEYYDSEGLTIYSHDSNGDKFHKKYYDSDGHTVDTSKLGDHSHLYDDLGNPLNSWEVMLAHKKAKKKEQSRKKKD